VADGAVLESVNVGRPVVNPDKPGLRTGIDKRPADGPVQVRDPGPKETGLGSGLVGDFVGDGRNHGGADQALYAFAREDLDHWQGRLDRDLANGSFGENLTTRGVDVNDARVGERWRIGGTVVVEVTGPRIPCATFRGRIGVPGWLKTFTAHGRPGAYLRVLSPGTLKAGDPIEVLHRPAHDVSVALVFRATTIERSLLPSLLAAGDDLLPEFREMAEAGQVYPIG
jgi:MOSC domain-containing protein YiiM